MRLIDGDALMDEANSDGAYGYVDAKQISEAPTVDVITVVHGRWEVKVGMNFFKERNCPVCKKRIESNFWSFCPNCGAKMDLEG